MQQRKRAVTYGPRHALTVRFEDELWDRLQAQREASGLKTTGKMVVQAVREYVESKEEEGRRS